MHQAELRQDTANQRAEPLAYRLHLFQHHAAAETGRTLEGSMAPHGGAHTTPLMPAKLNTHT